MVFAEKRLGQSQIDSITNTTLYTVGAGKVGIVKDFIITNTTGTATTISIWLVPNGEISSDGNAIVKDLTIPANDLVHFSMWQVLENVGDSIQSLSGSTASITITVSGAEI